MAGGSRKHGAHRVVLGIPGAAAGAAADTVFDIFTYDAYAETGVGLVSSPSIGYDQYIEQVVEVALTMAAVLTGAATNFVAPRLTHRNAAGTTVDQIRVDFSAAGVVTVAFAPSNLGVASGAVVPGMGTGTLLLVAGAILPWTLAAGDTVTLDRLTTGTGIATPAMSATLVIAGKGA